MTVGTLERAFTVSWEMSTSERCLLDKTKREVGCWDIVSPLEAVEYNIALEGYWQAEKQKKHVICDKPLGRT